MKTINLKAHFDGKKILLDEPFNIEPDTKLIVTVLPKHMDEDREGLLSKSLIRLGFLAVLPRASIIGTIGSN